MMVLRFRPCLAAGEAQCYDFSVRKGLRGGCSAGLGWCFCKMFVRNLAARPAVRLQIMCQFSDAGR